MADADTLAAAKDAATGEKANAVHYVDLVLGGWRPREAAFQLAAALGVELSKGMVVDLDDSNLATGAAIVDIAVRGDRLVNQAWEDACRIADALPATAVAVVFVPQFDLPLRADNEWFFHFLRRLGQTVVAAGGEPRFRTLEKSPFEPRRSVPLPEWRPLPDDLGPAAMRLLRLFPGLLPRRVAEAADLGRATFSLVPVGAQHFLVPTACRDVDPRQCAFAFDALEDLEGEDEGLKAIAQTYCTSHFADIATLSELGLRHFRAGSRDLGRDLVARAHTLAHDPVSIARTENLLLEMSLFERRFAEVVAAPPLSPRADAGDRERFLRLKHWARLGIDDLSGVPEIVAASLRRLGTGEAIDADNVLLLERIARARVARGDLDGAATVARSVASALSHAGEKVDQRLVYANAMTLVAINEKSGDHSAVAREIDRAFATTSGARGAVDVLLMNVLRARAEPDRTSEVTVACWLRAGLAWLDHEPREGLGREVVDAILHSDKVAGVSIDSAISSVLADGLARARPDAADPSPGRVPGVCPASMLAKTAWRHMFGGPGAAILWTPVTVTTPPGAPPRARLIRLITATLAKMCPPFAAIESGTIAADVNLGTDIPATRDEALSVALRRGVEDFCYGDERLRLDAAARERLAGDLEIRLSPAVNAVTESGDGVIVTFKRYLPRAVLFDQDARLVAPLREGDRLRLKTLPIIADGRAVDQVMPALRRLEAAHIVRLDVRSQ